ncbi:MAG: NAD-glutamate dehydrogenase [Minwuia sp.]|uniref:NAD-glutamate dehydrogenase n=1 Tax=Minwuia sp. TaxID=2493630 RepID=UPI003A864F0E
MDARTEPSEHLIRDVQEICHERLGADEEKALARFAAQVLRDVSADDAIDRTPEQTYGALLSLWKLARTRKPGEHRVRVYNPKLDTHGWTTPHTVIETVTDDMPFIVDSVVAALNPFDGQIYQLLHPVVRLRRGEGGELLDCLDTGEEGARESVIQIEFSTHTGAEDLAAMEHAINAVMRDVRSAVEDWPQMLETAKQLVADLDSDPPPLPVEDVAEGRALLEWMIDNHFTFLGYREYDYLASVDSERLEIVPDSGLGLLRSPARRVMERSSGEPALSPEVREFLSKPELIIVTKANKRSTVHRPVHLDYIGIKRFNEKGEVIGERRFVGLFTSAAYNRTPRDIPYLRRKATKVLERSGFDPRGHAGKALVNVLETFPRDELFQIPEDELYRTAMGILGLFDRPRIKLFVRRDRFERFFSCLVFVPRERYDSELRRIFEKILAEELGGRISAFYTQIGDLALARLHIIVGGSPTARDVDVGELEARLVAAARSWEDELGETLEGAHGEEKGAALFRRYGRAFSAAYRETFPAAMGAIDIDHIEADRGALPGLNIYRMLEDEETVLRLKLFRKGPALALSDVLPMLENMGLRVLAEQTYPVGDPVEPMCWIHDFEMETRDGRVLDMAEVKPAFETGFVKIFAGEMENDGFNGLIVAEGLKPGEVVLLRAYCKYLRQAGIGFSQEYIEETLARNSEITSLILELFFCLLDPENGGGEETAETLVESVKVMLEEVSSLDEDRILRRYLNAVQSTLRTNYFQNRTDADGNPYVSLKFDSQALTDLPLPRPHKEIFVYSPRFEGVHLRGGPVARGGLRWSDRREDFRTEVLGLVKAQMVKNSVIVPVGSKGGFVPKRPPADGGREAVMAEGIACYRGFISGLLDVTDNIVEGDIVPPTNVVRRDGDDPYLVVAADKGTATFSDYANQVAIDYGFWLGDAFASGGAAGYDHKGMGITARGAWECVKRHFREMGTDIQTEPFTVVGVGDMSGDVFGNGMLLSEQIRLVGAFDHRHIFIDPDPDPASSFAERKRVFELGRSSWEDYDRSVLSKGAMIVPRSAKKVELTPEAAAALDVPPGEMSPQQVLQAILRAPADLLWFGGIGTYVKAHHESNADAGDRANDAIRINGEDLRVKVVGEGANLGITQLGRVEFAQRGGRSNTDFVDNSAGVDCSDHEVNLKILLGAVESAGDMTRKQRDTLLAEMTDEVAELVLEDNYIQGQAITLAEASGADGMGPMQRLMRSFGQEGLLNRQVEFLPDDEEIAERTGGLTRPEISVLLSYAKMTLKTELMAGGLPDDPGQEATLRGYFPKALQERFPAEIAEHRLRREIIATIAANFIVNRCGPTFARLAQDELGVDASDVGRVALAVAEIFDLGPVWDGIDALDNRADAAVQTRMLVMVQQLMSRASMWFLRAEAPDVDRPALVARFQPAIAELSGNLRGYLSEMDAAAWTTRADGLTAQGVDRDLAARVAGLQPLASTLDVVHAAQSAGREVATVAETYFAIGSRLGLDWLRAQASSLSAENGWERQAIQMLLDDSYAQQRQLVVQAFADGADGPAAALEMFSAGQGRELARADQTMTEIRAAGAVDLGRLVLANRQIGRLVTG